MLLLKPSFTQHLECIWNTQLQNLKNILKNLCKHYCFIKLKTCFQRQYFELGIQIVSLLVYSGTLGEKAIQSCDEYHMVQRPRKWGLNNHVDFLYHSTPDLLHTALSCDISKWRWVPVRTVYFCNGSGSTTTPVWTRKIIRIPDPGGHPG